MWAMRWSPWRTLDLKGYVRNLADGRVQVVAGDEADLERFCRAIRLSIIDKGR